MKYIPWVLIGLAVLALFAWLLPAYKSVVTERDQLKTENQKLKSSIDTVTYYPSGKKQTETHVRTETLVVSEEKTKDYSKTVTKRGMFTICAYVDIKTEIAASVSYQVLGPVNIAVAFSNGQPYLGCGLSF